MIEKYENEVLDERFFYKKLDSGLDVYVVPKVGYSKFYAYFGVKYGAVDHQYLAEGQHIKHPLGVAHFLEHKLFESKEKDTFKEFHNRGASVNAYTNATSTVYYVTGTYEVEQNIKALMQLVSKLDITKDDVVKEKSIIGQEIAMYRDQADWLLYFQTLKALYWHHPIRNTIAGELEDIEAIQLDVLHEAFNTFYSPSNSFVVVVGDVVPTRIIETVDKSQSSAFLSRGKKIEGIKITEPSGVKLDRLDLPFPVALRKSFIAFKDQVDQLSAKQIHYRSMVSKLMHAYYFGRASELYNRLYQSGTINTTFGIEHLSDLGYGYTLIGGDGHDPDAVWAAIGAYGIEHLSLPEKDLYSEGALADFERIKRQFLGRQIMSFNSIEHLGHHYVSQILKGINPLDFVETANKIQLSEVVARFGNHLVDRQKTIVTLEPSVKRL